MQTEMSTATSYARSPVTQEQQEAELERMEASVADAEQRLADEETAAAEEQERVGELRRELEEHIEALEARGVPGTRQLLRTLPAIPSVDPGPRNRARSARLAALQTRSAAVRERERNASRMQDVLAQTRRTLAEARKAADRLEHAPTHVVAAPPRQPSAAERRTQRRVQMDCEIDMETESNFFCGFAGDISTGGIFVACFDPIDIGDVVDLTFQLNGGPRISARASVRWVRDTHQPGQIPGAGLQFEDLSAEARAAIEAFINERPTIFYEA